MKVYAPWDGISYNSLGYWNQNSLVSERFLDQCDGHTGGY
jgi:hypothetical protein